MKDVFSYVSGPYTILQTPCLWQSHQNYNYMLAHQGEAFIFDPGEYTPIQKTLESHNLKLAGIYLTHHHPDHSGATLDFKNQWNVPVFGYEEDEYRLPGVSHRFNENETLEIAGLESQVLFLPGHTLGLCAFYFPKMKWLFSNDLLFSLGCGRVFEGTYQQMYQSLKKVSALPDDTLVFASHEYTLANLNFALSIFPQDPPLLAAQAEIRKKIEAQVPTVPSTLGFEKKHNPFLRWSDKSLRKTLGLTDAEDWQIFAKIRELKDR